MQGAWPVTDFLPRAVAGRGWPRRGRLWRSRGRVVLGVRRFERGGCRVESRCRPRPYVLKLTGEVPELLFGPVLELHEPGAGAFDGTKQLVELEIDRFAVTVLGVLDDEHHQEGDDRGARIDDELSFFFQAEFGIRDKLVTGVQTCALPIWHHSIRRRPLLRGMDGRRHALGDRDRAGLPHPTCRGVGRRAPRLAGERTRHLPTVARFRSEERRVGKEGRSRWSPYH